MVGHICLIPFNHISSLSIFSIYLMCHHWYLKILNNFRKLPYFPPIRDISVILLNICTRGSAYLTLREYLYLTKKTLPVPFVIRDGGRHEKIPFTIGESFFISFAMDACELEGRELVRAISN